MVYMGPISKCEQIFYKINGDASCTLIQKLFTDGRIDKHKWLLSMLLQTNAQIDDTLKY